MNVEVRNSIVVIETKMIEQSDTHFEIRYSLFDIRYLISVLSI
jgi:hypothetical protein